MITPHTQVSTAIWLVEDSPLEARVAKRCLEVAYPVEVFSNAAEMIERLSEGTIPLALLLDLNLPGMSGIEACEYVRGIHDALDLPILLLTVRGHKESIVNGLAAGANDYVVKPFDGAELRARVGAVLRTRSLHLRALAAEQSEREALGEVASERRRLQALLTQTSAAVCVLRGHHPVCEYANPAFLRLAQVEGLVGRRVEELAPTLQGNPWLEVVERVMATAEAHIAQAVPARVQRTASGPLEDSFFKIIYEPSRDAEGTVVGVDVLAVDVTEQVVGQRKVEELLSLASHELKTPITSLSLHVQTLQRRIEAGGGTLEPERLKRSLDTVARQVRRQLRLVDDLVDVSRLTASKLKLEVEPVDVCILVTEIVERFREEDGADVEVLLQCPSSSMIVTDPFRLDQVITNLISNAFKYGAGNPITVQVEPAGTRRVRLSVRDEGIGIAPQDLHRVFDRFERAVPGTNYAGLGLGLWICRRIVEAMGGTISVKSELGLGSTFTVELPRSREAQEGAAAALDQPAGEAP
jgi:signal transduction histidine kinase